ncbi:UBAP1-MVB12-associated (UMA)-domain containing protein 1-like [Bombina bombina]|uniref:UBAP1-MVB12-associated (UMA)-domain containing protein 1-like n=1 Tax=Bombina bombina TaxID=8345 RepID=UPI00235A4960|nr:UBAP1-MVB12-associated (UMA)-domain containing protein 1-like [Bombina bombina]
MFNFFRKSQDAKKITVPETEDGGFVLLGQTSNEQRIGRPPFPVSDFTYKPPFQVPQETTHHLNRDGSENNKLISQTSEGNAVMAEVLNDIPFTLAPHVQEMQNICKEMPERVPLYNMEENFARFHYDFPLENSVLCSL